MNKEIYALFEYYGDAMMCPYNYLCIKYGSPYEILTWLLSAGYLREILSLGMMMGAPGDEKYLKRIEKLDRLGSEKVTAKTIQEIDIRMPSCCTCRAISKDFSDMPAFKNKVKELLAEDNIATVAKDEKLEEFIQALDFACESEEGYEDFQAAIPFRYL